MTGNSIHSLLFVPARENMLAKIASSEADAWIIDLEDSILKNEKAAALATAMNFLTRSPNAMRCFVRIDCDLFCEQVAALRKVAFKGFMIPKLEDCRLLEDFRDDFSGRENIALIETPRGMIEMGSIVANENISALAFGAEDYTAFVNMENSEANLTAIKTRIVMYAKAYGKYVYDTPSFSISDVAKAGCEATCSASLGFDGKLVIHPKLVTGVNNAFRAYDIDIMRQVVAAYEKEGKAVLALDGVIYEKMHIDQFRRIIRENQNIRGVR